MDFGRLNPVTMITGATSGLGEACARDLAKRSQGGLILVDPDEDALSAVADDLAGVAPERVSMLAFDVTDPDRWAQASAFIHSQYGRLDWALVNVAARAATETDLVQWGPDASTSLDGAFLTLRTVLPLMRAHTQGGAIVVSAAAAAIKAEPVTGAPSVSKAGLLELIRAASKECAHDNIRINGVALGSADTWSDAPLFNDIAAETGGELAAFDKIAALARPLARYAEADDFGRIVAMLLSDESHATGATLIVDGGGAV